MNNFCHYPPPDLRCFWKDPLMTPHPTTPLQASFTATPLPIHQPSPLKILIIHEGMQYGPVTISTEEVVQYMATKTA